MKLHSPPTLRPFQQGLDLRIDIVTKWTGPTFQFKMVISGADFSKIFLPQKKERPARADNLWTSTCCEIFISPKDQSTYWEFNFSPSGDWAAYSFDGYRIRGGADAEIQNLNPYWNTQARRSLELSCFIPVTKLFPKDISSIDVSATAVVQTEETIQHWALAHAGTKPDFHLRESFCLNLQKESS